MGLIEDGSASLLRVYENGEYQYRFACPFCRAHEMHLKSYTPVDGTRGGQGSIDIQFLLSCSACGQSKVVRNMPICRGLGWEGG
jgi:transcription elongation factor Elf1